MSSGLIYSSRFTVRDEKHYDRQRPWPAEPGVILDCKVDSYGSRAEARWHSRKRKLLEPPAVPAGGWLLWLDSSMVPKVPLDPVVREWLADHDVAVMAHPERDCAYDEVAACVKYGKLDPRQGNAIAALLGLAGMPRKAGLFACGVIAFRTECRALRELWWANTLQTGLRDQIALPLTLHRLGDKKPKLLTIRANIWKNDWFEWVPHKH